jgi:hypothetical protein
MNKRQRSVALCLLLAVAWLAMAALAVWTMVGLSLARVAISIVGAWAIVAAHAVLARAIRKP